MRVVFKKYCFHIVSFNSYKIQILILKYYVVQLVSADIFQSPTNDLMHIIKQLQCLTLKLFLHKRICRTESWCKTHHEFYVRVSKSANFFVLDFRTNKINLRHSHTCWGTKGFSDLHDALNELKEIVLFATLKKKEL